MDAFLLKQIVAELAAELPGALVSKVHQPSEREIVLDLWGRGISGCSFRPIRNFAASTSRRTRARTAFASPVLPVPPEAPRGNADRGVHACRVRPLGADRLPLEPPGRGARKILFVRRTVRTPRQPDLRGRRRDDPRAAAHRLRRGEPGPPGVPGIPYRPLPKPARVFLPDVTREDAVRIFASEWGGFPRLSRTPWPAWGGKWRTRRRRGAGRARCLARSAPRPGPPVRGKRLHPRDRNARRRETADPPLPVPRGGVRRLHAVPLRERGGGRLLRGGRGGAGNRRPPATDPFPHRRAAEEGAPQAGKRRGRRGPVRRGDAGSGHGEMLRRTSVR